MMSKIFIKQYGAKRSGTCYVTELLRRNFRDVDVLIHGLGGKHSEPIDYKAYTDGPPELLTAIAANEVRAAIAIKHPYAWAWSYIRVHQKWRSGFKREMEKDGMPAAIVSVCKTWNDKNRAWRDNLPVPRKMFIRHEDLLRDFHGTMAAVQKRLELIPKRKNYRNVIRRMTPRDKISKTRFDASFPAMHEYLWSLGSESFYAVDETIDWELAEWFGYHQLNIRSICDEEIMP